MREDIFQDAFVKHPWTTGLSYQQLKN